MATVPSCMHGTWKEFDLVAIRDVDGFVGRVEQVFPTGLEKVPHRDHPHYVIKIRWIRANTHDEYALRQFQVPPGRAADADGVSHEVCQELHGFAWG